MGLFAFKRLREREAASEEVASFPVVEQAPVPEPVKVTGKLRNSRLRSRGEHDS